MALVHCRECGEMIAESAPTCPKCGASQQGVNQESFFDKFKPGSTGLKVLSVLIWIAGLIVGLVHLNKDRAAAISYLLWTAAGFLGWLILRWLFF